MKIRKIVAIIMIVIICIGVIGEFAPVVDASVGPYRPSEQPSDTVSTRYTVLLLDVEGGFSMMDNGVEIYKVDTPLEEVKHAAKKFVEQISEAEGNNYVAIVAYGENSEVICDFTS